jgi:outer membrane protein TolC
MKIKILLLMALFAGAQTMAQNKLEKKASDSVRTGASSTIREKLVQLAIQNPAFEIAGRNVTIGAYNIKKAKISVLNNISIQGNVNEFSIKPNSSSNSLFPRYNLGVVVPFGLLSTRSNEIKIAKEAYAIAVAQKNERFQLIKREVLSKYEDYLLTKDLLDLQIQVAEDTYSNYLKTEKDFSEAKVNSEEYTRAYKDYHLELAKQKSLERDLRVIILELEEYIATDFNNLIKSYR